MYSKSCDLLYVHKDLCEQLFPLTHTKQYENSIVQLHKCISCFQEASCGYKFFILFHVIKHICCNVFKVHMLLKISDNSPLCGTKIFHLKHVFFLTDQKSSSSWSHIPLVFLVALWMQTSFKMQDKYCSYVAKVIGRLI